MAWNGLSLVAVTIVQLLISPFTLVKNLIERMDDALVCLFDFIKQDNSNGSRLPRHLEYKIVQIRALFTALVRSGLPKHLRRIGEFTAVNFVEIVAFGLVKQLS